MTIANFTILYHIISHYINLIMLYHIISYYIIFNTLYHPISCYDKLYYIKSYYIKLHHNLSTFIIPYRIIPDYINSQFTIYVIILYLSSPHLLTLNNIKLYHLYQTTSFFKTLSHCTISTLFHNI